LIGNILRKFDEFSPILRMAGSFAMVRDSPFRELLEDVVSGSEHWVNFVALKRVEPWELMHYLSCP
jgi:hypothetical protein